ncbi:MAG: hypothetical protein PHP85_01780 [Gallionella sp.]|nr:hypothetical protein [Gallionella sp.]
MQQQKTVTDVTQQHQFCIQINFAGGSPAAGDFLLSRQKKVAKEKATPACRAA